MPWIIRVFHFIQQLTQTDGMAGFCVYHQNLKITHIIVSGSILSPYMREKKSNLEELEVNSGPLAPQETAVTFRPWLFGHHQSVVPSCNLHNKDLRSLEQVILKWCCHKSIIRRVDLPTKPFSRIGSLCFLKQCCQIKEFLGIKYLMWFQNHVTFIFPLARPPFIKSSHR